MSDLAEQMFYAKFQRLPDPKYFLVTATVKPGSPQDAPVYELQICLDAKQPALKSEVNINGPIWSPEVYQGVVQDLAGAVGLSANAPAAAEDAKLLAKLTDGMAETIETEDENLSGALENNFTDPALHEQAAVLLGRSPCGNIRDIFLKFALRSHASLRIWPWRVFWTAVVPAESTDRWRRRC